MRELDGMLHLSLHLAARGLPTLLGERMVNRYVLSSGKPVIYFDSDQDVSVNEAVLAAGGEVVNLNPEGLNQWDRAEIVDNHLRILPCVSRICAWGEHQARLMRSRMPSDKAGLVTVTGYPSFDLANRRFLPYYRDESLVRLHGEDYILINTSFTCNHVMGFEHYIAMLGRMKEWRIYKDEQFITFKRRAAEYQRRLLEPFALLARHLATRFPGRHVIIRPHPVENMDFYRERTSDLPNVFVDRSGSVRNWIATAQAVIHHDCTTGLEALLMGKPLIQYRPIFDAELAAPIVCGLGEPAETQEAVADIIAGLQPGALVTPPGGLLAPYFANLERSAARSIAEIASGYAADGRETWAPQPLGAWEAIKCWRKYVSKLIRARQPGRNGRKVRYALAKFPRLPVAEVQNRISRLAAIQPELPPVSVTRLALNTYLVRPAA
ncbi:hypothetical protein M7784_12250 [Desulfovibrio aminophilus]|nr:hypothetical protein [Desulfovibrio aminophilus]